MTLTTEKGTFTKPTSTGAQSQTVNLVNGSLTPKLLILWSNGLTTDGTYTENIVWTYGFSDGTNDVCQTMTALDNSTTQVESYSWNNNCVISLVTPTGTPVENARADVTSFNAGNVILNWTSNTNTAATVIHYIVAGGDDIANVSAVSTIVGDQNTGAHSYTGSGTSFLPTFALTMTGSMSVTTANSLQVGGDHAVLSLGAARSASEEFCISARTESVGTADTDMNIHNNACLLNIDIAGGAENFLADFTQFDNVTGGGITVNVSNGAANNGQFMGFLFIKTINQVAFEVGSLQQRSGTGTQDISFSNTTLNPEIVFLAGINSATVNATVAHNYVCLGGADGTRQGCTWCGDQNAATLMVNTSVNLTSQVYIQATPNATASSSTTNAQCTMNDMATAGKFQLSWGTADSTLRQMAFWTVGTLPAPQTYNRAPTADTVTISEQSLTASKYHAYEGIPSPDTVTISESSLVRLLQSNRVPSPDTVTVSENLSGYNPNQPIKIKVGTITKDTTTGAHTQNFTNEAGFAPKGILLWGSTQTATGDAANAEFHFGFSDDVNKDIGIGCSVMDGVSPIGVTIAHGSTRTITICTNGSTSEIAGGTIAFGSNGWDIVWAVANATQYKINYLVYGYGNSLVQTAAFSAAIGGTGNRDYTVTGNFQGDIVFMFWTAGTTGSTSDGNDAKMNMGVAMSSSKQWCIASNTQTTTSRKSLVSNRCIKTLDAAGTVDVEASFVQWNSNGFRLNVNSASDTSDHIYFLVIKGGNWDLGTFLQPTSTGNQVINLTDSTIVPSALMFGSVCATSSTSVVNDNNFMLGATDGTSTVCSWMGCENGQATSIARKSHSETKAIRLLDEVSGSVDIKAEATISDMTTPGEYTVNWSIVDSTQREIGWISTGYIPAETGTNYVRTPSADSTTISDVSITPMLSRARVPSPDSITITDSSLTRMLSASRVPTADTVVIADSSLIQSQTRVRAPSTDNTTVADFSLTRLLSAVRAPATVEDTITIMEDSLTRMLQAFRAPVQDTVTVGESVSGGKLFERTPSPDSITVSEDAITRLLSATRTDSDTTTVVEASLTRSKSQTLAPPPETTTVTDASLTSLISQARTPSIDNTVITDSSLTTILTRTRLPSADTITISESSLLRMLSASRTPAEDTVVLSESIESLLTTPGQFNRTVNDSVTIAEQSLTRLLQTIRVPGADTTNVNEQVTRIKTLSRVPTPDTITVSESAPVRFLTFSRSVPPDTVSISEQSLTRLLQAIRVPAQDTVIIGESVSGGRVFPRVPATENTTLNEVSLIRTLSVARTIQESVDVVEMLLQRMLSSARSLEETVLISELAAIITQIRMLEETVDVSEVSLNAALTVVRMPEIDFTSIGEQIFYTGGVPTNLVAYAIPSEVRPLLGNIGGQRTDPQIQLAIDSATDEINRRTNRQPPNDWKITENDFDIVKKICRFKAALEMAIGIKDFEDREWMQKEIEEMFLIIEQHDPGGAGSNDIVGSSGDETYALNEQGLIWSTRYKNLKKNSGTENDTTINPNT